MKHTLSICKELSLTEKNDNYLLRYNHYEIARSESKAVIDDIQKKFKDMLLKGFRPNSDGTIICSISYEDIDILPNNEETNLDVNSISTLPF